MSSRRRQLYEFGPFRLDAGAVLLWREGKPVPLARKAVETLLVLVEHRGDVVLKQRFFDEVWHDVDVADGSLTVNISHLRKALGRDERGRAYIETIPGRGYRFVADVRVLDDGVPEPKPPPPPPLPPPPSPAPPVRRRLRWVVAAVVLVLALAAAVFFVYRGRRVGADAPARTLAVLPFVNLKPDAESDFLGFSLASAVAAKLGDLRTLVVRPAASVYKYRAQPADPARAAEELKVDTLLTGSYLKEDDRLYVTVQLVDMTADRVIWQDRLSLRYDRLSAVQEQVSRRIIDELALKLTPEEDNRLRSDRPHDDLAYDYYLRGVDFYYAEDYLAAIDALRKSVERDPTYARAWAQLGSAYSVHGSLNLGGREFYEKAQESFERALDLDDRLSEAQAFLADLLVDTNRFEEATALMREALRKDPGDALARWELAYAYRFGGMLEESIAEGERSRDSDPTRQLASAPFSAYLYSGRYDDFVARMSDPEDSALLLFYRGLARYYAADFERAAADFRRSYELDDTLLASKVGMALLGGLEGRGEEGLRVLREVEAQVEANGVIDGEGVYKIAQGYAALGDRRAALRALRRSIEVGGFVCLPYFLSDPLLASLRAEPEFAALLELARRRHEAYKRDYFGPAAAVTYVEN